MKAPNLKHLDSSTVWNYHSVDLKKLGFNKNSNLNKSLAALYKKGKRGKVTVVLTCIGREQHSASFIKIFEGVATYMKTGKYDSRYSYRCAIYKLKDFRKEEV